jgi:hypothetical protein
MPARITARAAAAVTAARVTAARVTAARVTAARVTAAGAIAACVVVACMATAPATAVADGDPASDVLLGQNVFYPYSPPTPNSVQRSLNAETAAAAKAGFPIKVALIAAPTDLGVIPGLFNKPQKYADFLDQEISFQKTQLLLVVMPAGYGTKGLPKAAATAAATLAKPTGRTSEALANAALAAVPKLAAAAGHPIKADSPAGAGSSGGGSNTGRTILLIVLILAVVATAGALVAVRRRRGVTEGS